MAVVCFGYYFYHYSCVEWGESDRWSGWSGYRNVGDYRSDAGNPGLCVGEYGLCRLSEYHVHSAFGSAFIGATIGFLWYNSYPAQVFMGDTGSLALGGIIAVFAIIIHKELLIPALCGIFLMENLSVVMQVSYFKYTKRKFGEGRRIFLMAPLHHHFQKKGIPEPKIVTRFWIIGIILAVVTIVTLKIR